MTHHYSSLGQVQEAQVQGPVTGGILTTHDLGVGKVENMCHCLFFLLPLLSVFAAEIEGGLLGSRQLSGELL